MPLKDDWKLGSVDGRAAAAIVLEEIARRRMSRRHLADLSRISLSTLEKVLSGRRPFTLATMVRIEQALGVSLRVQAARNGGAGPAAMNVDGGGGGTSSGAVGSPAGSGHANGAAPAGMPGGLQGVAPDDLGNYARAAVAWIEGSYLTIRPSFGNASALYAYRTDIGWDEERSILTFREAERVDTPFSQFGVVSVPNQSGYVYLVTNRHGQHRLAVVSRPTITGEMHGLLTTLKVGRGAQLTPIATPIVLVPIKAGERTSYGQIAAGHGCFDRYRALLQRTLADEFALLAR